MRHPRFPLAVPAARASLVTLAPVAALAALATFATLAPAPAAAADEPPAAPAATGASIPVNLEIKGEVRHRFEIDGRDRIVPNSSTTEQNFLRTRLSVKAALPKKVTVLAQAQDARIFGEEESPESGIGARSDMHQGYILAEDLVAPGLWLRLGRMELSYANERLMGASDWSNTGRAFDGIVLGYRGALFDVEVFETKIGEGVGDPFRGRDYDFFGAVATIRALPDHTIDAFAFYDHDADTLATGEDALKRLTIGGRFAGSRMGISYEVEGGAQTGDAGPASVSAAYFGGRVSYALASPVEPTIGVGVDWLSGDDDPTDDEVKVFDTLFGTGHKFYGYMDLFTDIPDDTGELGLLDILFKVSAKPTGWLSGSVTYHNFRSAEDLVVSGSGGNETFSSFGSEFDVIAKIPCTDNVAVESGFSYFASGDLFDQFVSASLGSPTEADNAFWAYLQTRVNY